MSEYIAQYCVVQRDVNYIYRCYMHGTSQSTSKNVLMSTFRTARHQQER